MPNTYAKGALIRSTGTFEDENGNPTDPATIRFEFIDPSGNETEYEYGADPEVVRDDVGVYHVDVDIDESGKWFMRWYAPPGAGQTADETIVIAEESAF